MQVQQPTQLRLEAKKHVAFWLRHLRLLPRPYVSADTQRATIAFFCLSALDLLGAFSDEDGAEAKITRSERESYKSWLWSLQVGGGPSGGGFVGSPALCRLDESSSSSSHSEQGHLAMTYATLLNLAILRDDFSQLNRQGLRSLLQRTQQPDGSFSAAPGSPEKDPRFVYCAFAICYMLNDWTAVRIDDALDYLESCLSYDGAFGQGPGQESHGGSTYCSIAAFSLCRELEERFPPKSRRRRTLTSWLLARQSEEQDGIGAGGFNGRIGKAKDSCYSFWCGATLSMLSYHGTMDLKANAAHLLGLQTPVGGIPKMEGEHPDAMHSYLSLAALALHAGGDSDEDEEDGWRTRSGIRNGLVDGLDPRVNVSLTTLRHISQTLRADQKQTPEEEGRVSFKSQ